MAHANSNGGASPRKASPVKLHPRGQWFVKRKGKFFYLGRDHDAALQTYLNGKDYFDAGRKPPEPDDRLTVKRLVNLFLTDADQRVGTGEMGRETFRGYKTVAQTIVDVLGRDTAVEDLRPVDFAKLRAHAADGRSLVTLGNFVTRARVVLNHAEGADLIEGRIRFGKAFDRPSKDKLRGERQAKPTRDLSAGDVLQLLESADTATRCWVLLGINAAYGPTDLCKLPLSALDLTGGWSTFPRPKTSVPRRAALWSETIAALNEYLRQRQEPKAAYAGLLFVHQRRTSWGRDGICHAFKRLRDSVGLDCGLYDLRRTFRTVADATLDGPAIDTVMGHTDSTMGATYRQRVDDCRLQAVAEHIHGWLYGTTDAEGGQR